MTFEKVSKFKYLAKDAKETIDEINLLIDKLSGDRSLFLESANDNLLQTILSRLVAVEFFKEGVKLDEDVLTVMIEVPYNNVTYITTLGLMNSIESVNAIGISDENKDNKLYIVESYYVK